MRPIFITGIGTDVGKTVVSAIVTEALGAAYWKPVQAGYDQGTDAQWVGARISGGGDRIKPEVYKLRLPASPHIAAREEGVTISLDKIAAVMPEERPLVIEGAGGLMVPLNESEFVIDLINKLNAKVLLVSKNYLGSINHSLLTAAVCQARGVDVAGWIFNGDPSGYEKEIAAWSGIGFCEAIPFTDDPNKDFVREQARRIRPALLKALERP
ncbi:MAG TPA: dethiobiotin synthase [Puia sp.]|nr:dethiobiotin synthase [Puia sp.]